MQNRRNNKCVFLRSFLQSLRFCLIRIFVKVYLGWVHSFISHSPIPDQSDTVHIKPQPGALLQLQTTFHRERYTRYKLTCLDTRRCLESRPSWTDVILSYSILHARDDIRMCCYRKRLFSAPINCLTNAARGLQSPGQTHLA